MEPILLRARGQEDSRTLESARRRGVYSGLAKALDRGPAEIVEEVKRSDLRGRGGAGFPAGLKWQFTQACDSEAKYLICNADESEPGTFKDREIIRTDPHLLLEGIAIAAYAVGAHTAVIYIRGEFPQEAQILEEAIGEAYAEGVLGRQVCDTPFSLEVLVHPGAGAYICGEETALLNSLEGRRGSPRVRPPFPAVSGYLRSPTVVNNVETLACVPSIIEHGARWFARIGRPRNTGPKLYSVSGHVESPGVYELPLGTPYEEIIFNHCGGLRSGRTLKAFIPGGVASQVLPADRVGTAADFDSVWEAGSTLGSGGLIVMDDATCMVDVAKNCLEFMVHESCGKCSPCRIGTPMLLEKVTEVCEGRAREDVLPDLERLADHVKKASLCGLGQTAPAVLVSTLRHFRNEYETHITNGGCEVCRTGPE
jgi:NADH-quinone oxidoreductase subunit F